MKENEAKAETEDEIEDTRMTLGEHLDELRVRLIKSVLALLIAFAACWVVRTTLTDWVFLPYQKAAVRLNVTMGEIADERIENGEEWAEYYDDGYPEVKELKDGVRIRKDLRMDAASIGFFLWMKVCFYFALFIGGPILLWQVWQFIAAGLYRSEKSVVYAYFPASVTLFMGGVVFGYFVMVPNALYFLAAMGLEQKGAEYWENIANYWSFLTSLTLALGAVFQLPVVMLAVSRMGLVEPKTFAKFRGHMIIGALVLSALLTPPDPFTQALMAVPVILLYELGHVISRIAVKRQATEK